MHLVERQPKLIPSKNQILRTAVATTTRPTFRKIVSRTFDDGLSRLEQLAKEGSGSIILLNHFSEGETTRAIAAVLENPVLGKREIVVPQGIHHYKNWYGHAGRAIGVTVCPITIEDTLKYVKAHPEKASKYQEALSREGAAALLNNYFTQGVRVLNEGGTVILFPQGGRRPYLESVTSAVSTLVNRTNRAQVDQFAVMFMGVEIPGVEDYTSEALVGLNLGTLYRFKPGRTLIKKELLSEAESRGLTIDQFVLEELKLLVPPSYLSAKIS